MNERLEKIRAEIARINELNASELDALQTELGSLFDDVFAEETTPENLTIVNELSSAIEATMARSEEIAAATAQAEQDKAAAAEVRNRLNGDPEDDKGSEEGDDKGDGAPADPDAPVEDKTPALVAAGAHRSSPRRMRNTTSGIRPINAESRRTALIAAAPIGGVQSGHTFTDRWELAEAMSRQLQGMHPAQSHGRVVVASADFRDAYDPSRRLVKGDFVGNEKKFDAVVGLQALVASGGTCLPGNVDYGLETWATADRPIKAGLAQYQADRGALTYRNPPTVAALAGATAVWTEATDANPDGAVKPVLAITCEGPVTTYVNAIPTRLGFGNLMNQFDPDTIAANTDLAIAAAARIAEIELLTQLQAACTLNIEAGTVLGASRDFFQMLDLVTANFRYTHRLSPTQMLTVILPEWFKNAIRSDRVAEQAHDNAGSEDNFGVSDAWIDDMLSVRHINAIWALDGLPIAGDSSYPFQGFNGFTASAVVPVWPTKVVINIYIEGSVQFLDSGLLNLGVVRDATLDETNDYETFLETFEGLAFRGFSGGALQLVFTYAPTGCSRGLVAC
jgi:hypothetical protein